MSMQDCQHFGSSFDRTSPTKSDQRSSSHAIIRLVRPAEIPSERWLAELLGACHRLKDARLSMAPAPPRHLTTIQPLPFDLKTSHPTSSLIHHPKNLPFTKNVVDAPPTILVLLSFDLKYRARESQTREIKESQAILLAAKKLEKEKIWSEGSYLKTPPFSPSDLKKKTPRLITSFPQMSSSSLDTNLSISKPIYEEYLVFF
ncbi:hypothetical protein H4Q26_003397 [Puccinia striiformis f. sp. tritici PST-130]|nr:hypothetical protein H4Q26_003397 [Puccinia striiformis f. sp. tritici PST-130]